MKKAKGKCLSSKCQKGKTHVRETDEHGQPPKEGELSLYSGSDLDDQIERLVDPPYIANENGGSNEEGEDSDEDDLIRDIENNFNLVEQTGELIGNK